MNDSISVITPVYNEALLLDASVRRMDAFLAQHFSDYEILIVESGSSDRSGEISDLLAEALPQVRVIHEGRKNGYGSALRLGFREASKDLVWVVTADLPFALEHILTACPLLTQVDCVLSYRVDDRRDRMRKLRSLVYNTLAKLILGLRVRHVNSAFKVFKRPTLQGLALISNGWTIDGEIILEITRRRIPYTEIPVALIDRSVGQSSITASDPLKMLQALFALRSQKGY